MPEELKNEEERRGVQNYEEFITELDKINNGESGLSGVEVVRLREYVKNLLDELERTSARIDELQKDFDEFKKDKEEEINKIQTVNRDLLLNYGVPLKKEEKKADEGDDKKTLSDLIDEEEERGEL